MGKLKDFLNKNSLLAATAVIMTVCALCISIFSGFLHEVGKVKSILVNVFLVTMLLFLVSDTIKFLVLSMDRAWWPHQQASFNVDKNATIHTRTHYLKMRINTLRSQLLATEKHCNEPLNLMYQINAKDLWLYGKYFLLLMCLVLVSWDELLYYNTKQKYTLFKNNQTRTLGVVSIQNLHGLFTFLESALVAPFEPDSEVTGQKTWLYGDHTTKLGVVRLRQLRRRENFHIGWGETEFSDWDYMPRWELPYQRMLYTDKYWKIYEPWLPIYPTHSTATKMLFGFYHDGYTQSFPELHGYVTMLARSYNNSMKVVDYLINMNWLTWNTSAVFVDFTLYNVDANMFTICTVLIEQTPFGDIVTTLNIISVQLQFVDQLGTLGIVVVLIYFVVLIQYAKSVVITLWYEPYKLRSMWNKLDLIILVLNVIVIVLVIIREIVVSNLLEKVESSSKLVFLDFRLPTRLHVSSTITVGFLVCMATLRLWRVLLFASVFQLFSNTLYSAWKALASTAILILIFLFGYGMAVVIINGNNTVTFEKLLKSIISSLCFSFGFTSQFNPRDLFHGGSFLGLILYLILAFVVVQLLMNLFVSTINDYFLHAKLQRDAKALNYISFLQFLRVEYAPVFRFCQKLPFCRRGYKRHNRTVTENLDIKMDKNKRWSEKKRYQALSFGDDTKTETFKGDEKSRQEEYVTHIERLYTVAALMQTQMALLDHLLFKEEDSLDESDDESDSEDEYV
ncbi:polycystic kidney disease 2-like 2 protein [Drosophila novamexicana]|uniref:polycystic kidney disease 2-like 2 protein n=1 Tax=Drosophila novamexicana TaxID=47314 RepID=UPI0011E58F9D|nr:polycystic kidney disease 2-like 2 protein [Drosophila novamexicana]